MIKPGMSLGKRLTLSFAVTIAFMAFLAILSTKRIAGLNTEIDIRFTTVIPKPILPTASKLRYLSHAISVFKLGNKDDTTLVTTVQAIDHHA